MHYVLNHVVYEFYKFLFGIFGYLSASFGYLKCTFSFLNFQCEHTTRTIYTTKQHRIVHKYTIWDAPM